MIRATIAHVPSSYLLVVIGVGARGIANARGRGVEAREISRLAEATPDGLIGRVGAAACLGGLLEEGTADGAGWELAVAIRQDLS